MPGLYGRGEFYGLWTDGAMVGVVSLGQSAGGFYLLISEMGWSEHFFLDGICHEAPGIGPSQRRDLHFGW